MKQQGKRETWQPPTERMTDGAYIFAGWQSIRAAADAVYEVLGKKHAGGIVTDDWNLIGLGIDAYRHQTKTSCLECEKPLWPHEIIRCLECKTPLCETCAPKHFWPKGRPSDDLHWFTSQIIEGIAAGNIKIESPTSDETLENILARGRTALSRSRT